MTTTYGDGGELRISGTLDINSADALRDALLDGIRRGSGLNLNLAEVDACDATAIQLFFAARRSAAEWNRTLRLTAVSDAVAQAGAAVGLPMDGPADPQAAPRSADAV